jgi:hypothetical protein
MRTVPNIGLTEMAGVTQHAPLVALGSYIREQDLLSPVYSRLEFSAPSHTQRPVDALVDLWVSMLAGCRSVSQINRRIRPDRTLAQSWGRQQTFAEQSTVARILDSCQAEQVSQLREGTTVLYHWFGQAPHHPWPTPLTVDLDLTELPASDRAEGSSRGYIKAKGGAVVS